MELKLVPPPRSDVKKKKRLREDYLRSGVRKLLYRYLLTGSAAKAPSNSTSIVHHGHHEIEGAITDAPTIVHDIVESLPRKTCTALNSGSAVAIKTLFHYEGYPS